MSSRAGEIIIDKVSYLHRFQPFYQFATCRQFCYEIFIFTPSITDVSIKIYHLFYIKSSRILSLAIFLAVFVTI